MRLPILFVLILSSVSITAQQTDLKLWYNKPATNWNEALPIGNGRLAAMVFGDPGNEHFQLNEETIWAGSPYNNISESMTVVVPLHISFQTTAFLIPAPQLSCFH